MNSLGLVGDGDELDLINDVELCFGLSFYQAEISQLATVGDLHRIIAARLQHAADLKGRGSGPAIAFFRLRAALRPMAPRNANLTPETRLEGLTLDPTKAVMARLEKASGLTLPDARRWLAGDWCFVAAVFPAIYALYKFSADPLIVSGVLVAIGAVLVRRDAGKFPTDADTLGKLASQTAARSFGHLAKDGASTRSSDIWAALRLIIAPHTALPANQIDTDTKLLAASITVH